jgi:hypothetical protein
VCSYRERRRAARRAEWTAAGVFARPVYAAGTHAARCGSAALRGGGRLIIYGVGSAGPWVTVSAVRFLCFADVAEWRMGGGCTI